MHMLRMLIAYSASLLVLAAIWNQPLLAAGLLVLNTTGKPPLNTPDQTGFIDQVAGEALRRTGLELKTVKLPAERGLKNANLGIDDGDMVRIAGLEKLYPNLIRVPEKIMDWEFSAFSYLQLDLNGKWSNLSSRSVSFLIGWKILEKNVPKTAAITKVKTSEQLFGLLNKRRTELVIYERWGGLKYLQENGITDVKLLTPPLAVRGMYIYLHKKHERLVPRLAAALREMKRDGEYQRIYEQTLAPLVKEQR